MSMSKDALEGMAVILRENGYEVALKESDNEFTNKKPYVSNRFNKIRDLDLGSLECDTCLFIDDFAVDDIEKGDYLVGSSSATIGYLDLSCDYDDDDEIVIKTNRTAPNGRILTEKLKEYDYAIKLSDVFKLMASNEDFND